MSWALILCCVFFFFSSRRRHTRSDRDWSSDVCSSDLQPPAVGPTRKTLLGLVVPVVPHDIFPFAAAAAGLYGAKHCTGWMRPVPSSGTRTKATPFQAPKVPL